MGASFHPPSRHQIFQHNLSTLLPSSVQPVPLSYLDFLGKEVLDLAYMIEEVFGYGT